MTRRPFVEWNCSECKTSGSEELHSTGSARSFLNRIIWRHQDGSPACSGLNVTIEVPYEALPSGTEMREWEEEQRMKRDALRAKGLAARRAALAKKAAKKKE
jgi:hypothetical protein